MINYIKALEVIEIAAKGNVAGNVSNILQYILYGIGFVLLVLIIEEVDHFFNKGELLWKKLIIFFIISGIGVFGLFFIVNKKNPPDYNRTEVRQIAKTMNIQNPENLNGNIEYLKTIAPIYVETTTETSNKNKNENENEDSDMINDKIENWINEKLNDFYNKSSKITPEDKKIFENLKK
jgi:hypothetical protein